jgi:hypothetical protein
MLTLKNFDNTIDPDILERGERYYRQGAVEQLKEDRSGEFIGHVRGTDFYAVRVVIDDDEIVEYSCGCPYNKGPLCKHVAAVLYALVDSKRDIDSSFQGQKRRNNTTKGVLPDDLDKLSKEELIKIVRDARYEHADVERHVQMSRATGEQYEDKQYIKNIVRGAIKEASDRYAGISYGDTLDAVQGALEVLGVAEGFVETQPRAAIAIYETVIEELAPLIERADDSDGDIGGTLDSAFQSLHELAVRIRDRKEEKFRKELFAYVLKEWSKKKYQGWDWPWMFLAISADLVIKDSEEREVERAIEKAFDYDKKGRSQPESTVLNTMREFGMWSGGGEWNKRYRSEQIAEIRLKIKERLHPEKVKQFLLENKQLYNVRERAIERYLASDDLKQARALAEEGVAQAERDKYPGLVIKFLEYLMRCAVEEGALDEAAGYAKRLFLQSHHDSFSYYRKTKEYAGPHWKEYLQSIIKTLKSGRGSGFGHVDKLADVYIEENMWEDLLALVQKSPEFVKVYGKRLEKRFPKETGKLYIKLATQGMEYPSGRGMYQEKCGLLRQAKHLGCESEVGQVVVKWRTSYERRRALMEELNKI